jgi:hypothetical protein
MRRTSGIRVGTIAILAVLLVALTVGAGAFALPSALSVRTAGPAHSESARTAAAAPLHLAAPTASKHVAFHAMPGVNASNNTTLTNVTISPINSTVVPGGHEVLTESLTCWWNNTTVPCPANLVANVSFTWSLSSGFSGWLNNTTGPSVQFNANWTPSATSVDVVANLSTDPANYTNSTVTAPAANITVAGDGDPTVTVKFTTPFQVYMVLPFDLTFNVTVTGGSVSPSQTWVSINVRDLISTCAQFSIVGAAPCPTVANVSVPVTSGETSFSQTINYTMMDSQGYANPTAGVFPADAYQYIAWVTDNNSAANVTVGIAQNVYPVFQVPSGVFDNPIPGTSLSTGNLTFAMTYTGDFITAAELSVKNATGQVVFLAAVFAVGQGNRTVVVNTAWLAVTPGVYTASVNVTTPYGNYLINQKYTVIPAGQTIYINQTSYHNASLLGGLSDGISGMLLLVIGLIIGLVVALVLGRMMWGTPSQPSSPQPWSPTSSNAGTSGSSGTGSSSTPPSTGSSDMGSEGSTTDK